MRRLVLAAAWLLSAFALMVPTGLALAQGELDQEIAGGHFYKQANGSGGQGEAGFAIVDDAQAPLWSEFRRLGGVSALGYPSSHRFTWDGFTVQTTQRVVLQWRPDTGQAVFVNVFDRLHDLGMDAWLQDTRQIPPLGDWSSDAGKPWNEVVANHLQVLEANPAIKARYNAVAGDPVQLNGLPMAPIADMGNVYVLRAQRVVIQQWKQDVPWAKAGDVTVALGGDIAKEAGLVPAAAARPLALTAAGTLPAPSKAGALNLEASDLGPDFALVDEMTKDDPSFASSFGSGLASADLDINQRMFEASLMRVVVQVQHYPMAIASLFDPPKIMPTIEEGLREGMGEARELLSLGEISSPAIGERSAFRPFAVEALGFRGQTLVFVKKNVLVMIMVVGPGERVKDDTTLQWGRIIEGRIN